jgi:hypothetical protein
MLTPHIIDNGLVIFNKVTDDYDITKKNPEFMLNVLHACKVSSEKCRKTLVIN